MFDARILQIVMAGVISMTDPGKTGAKSQFHAFWGRFAGETGECNGCRSGLQR
ncbi:hypothetical protein GCM10009100_24120 [Thalassospira tepidiphila]|nr:hypothetical protein TH47_06775 [Thalassospira sp. MCCC 1A02803]